MDVGAFVQENKRWLLGCAIGGLVFFIARGVISSIYDPDVARGKPRRLNEEAVAAGHCPGNQKQDESQNTAVDQDRC